MSGPIDATELDTCGCCEAGPQEPKHTNRPGLSELSYRIGTHPTLVERMKARIYRWEVPSGDFAGKRPLTDLATRAQDDPAIALMDAWAVVGDVLTFYQERIANEGFLRTATERRSILELARAIGYELNPGVAAEAYVAFTVDDAEGSPTEAPVPAGTQVQSVPASQDELPQTFETTEELVARVAWNAMHPLLEHPQELKPDTTRVYLEGAATGLEPGDLVLIIGTDGEPRSKKIVDVEVDIEARWTRIDFPDATEQSTEVTFGEEVKPDPTQEELALTRGNVEEYVFNKTWSESDLQAFLTQHEWDSEDVLAYVADLLEEKFEGSGELFALRERVGFFGHNAPRWETLPKPDDTRGGSGADDPYQHPWDGTEERTIWQNSQGTVYTEADVYLERTVSGVMTESWAVFEAPTSAGVVRKAYWVDDVLETSRADYALSAKVTALKLTDGKNLTTTTKPGDFKVRKTTAHVASEQLDLAALPVTAALEAGAEEILLGNMVLGLREGQAVALEGEEVGTDEYVRREVLILKEITHSAGRTKLTFEDGLAYGYKRDTVTLNANVVLANHGETVAGEVLGSGDGSQPNQRFKLKKHPLTHVGASGASGSKSTLKVRVDGVEWQQESSLYGLDGTKRSYIVRIDDDAVPSVIFGDGKSGARLPTGQENVRATYRAGIGSDGEVGAGSLTLLKTRPFGIRSVTSPLAASGADDPEKLEDARINAPLTVLTLGRIVSLQDYEDFARAYPGIGKAQAVTVWDGEAELVHITVADADGDEVVPPLYDHLLTAIEAARDPLRKVKLDSFQPFVFFVKAKVLIDDAYLWEDVESDVESALLEAFSFEERGFGQPVTAAEVLQVIHGVEAVVAVDLDELYKTAPSETPSGSLFNAVLDAQVARWDDADEKILLAELLLIHPLGIELSEMTP